MCSFGRCVRTRKMLQRTKEVVGRKGETESQHKMPLLGKSININNTFLYNFDGFEKVTRYKQPKLKYNGIIIITKKKKKNTVVQTITYMPFFSLSMFPPYHILHIHTKCNNKSLKYCYGHYYVHMDKCFHCYVLNYVFIYTCYSSTYSKQYTKPLILSLSALNDIIQKIIELISGFLV